MFAEALKASLIRGISWFESEVWSNAPSPLVIAVLDTDVRLIGSHLAVLGGSSMDDVESESDRPQEPLDVGAIAAARDAQVGWDKQWVQGLTPWHFELDGICEDPDLLGLLNAQLVKLAILFTCDRARSNAGPNSPHRITAEYRGREYVAAVPINERLPLSVTQAQTAALLQAVAWCYERAGRPGEPNWVADRLLFTQTRIAQYLEPHSPERRFEVLGQAMGDLLEGIRWQWKAFIQGKVAGYLEQEKQVEDVITDTVSKFAERTTDLTKGLSESVLAAIAVTIGSFAAAAFSTPFNAALFRFGVLTYVIYLLLVPALLGLSSTTDSLRTARQDFEDRLSRFKATIYADKVTDVLGSRIDRAQTRFYRWLVVAIVAYLGLAALGVAAAQVVPDLISSVKK
jgi:hypothetical protein